jgi:hypothetical protein
MAGQRLPTGQADLDELLNASLGFAQQQFASDGEFYPYAAAIRLDGETETIAAPPGTPSEYPAAADIIAACLAELTARQQTIRAAAIVVDVRLPELGSDAIEVSLEHVEGQALRVQLPYSKRRRNISYGPVRASADSRRIWAHS